MKRMFYLRVLLSAAVALCLLDTGCGRKEIVIHSVNGGQEIAKTVDTEKESASEDGSDEAGLGSPSAGKDDKIPETEAERGTDADRGIFVYVTGAVCQPGVYELPEGSRVFQAVEAAGGPVEGADLDWCNLALSLEDEDKLTIYTLTQTQEMKEKGLLPESTAGWLERSGGSAGAVASSGEMTAVAADEEKGGKQLVNINTASKEELMTLPGIGESRAEDIIAYRQHGGFSSIEQIMEISGIKTALFSKIRDDITVG